LLERRDLDVVRREKGRLRSYLLVSLKNFLAKARRRELTLRRGEGRALVPLDELLERERAKALRAPLILVVAAHLDAGVKIPAVEQLLASAAAAQAIMLASVALGFGAMWKTGSAAYDAEVKVALGFAATDAIVGFLYLGTEVAPAPPAPPAEWRELVREFEAAS